MPLARWRTCDTGPRPARYRGWRPCWRGRWPWPTGPAGSRSIAVMPPRSPVSRRPGRICGCSVSAPGLLVPVARSSAIRDRCAAGSLILLQPAAELVVQVFSVAGRERLCGREPVIPAPSGPALGSQEQGRAWVLATEALGELESVGDEEHPDLRVQQRAGDLVADLGPLALVGSCEGFVEQHETVRSDVVSDGAHPPQLVVQPPAGHAGILRPDEVGEDAVSHIRLER